MFGRLSRLRRLTVLVFLVPWRYVVDEEDLASVSLDEWGDETFVWEDDPFWGYYDVVQHPKTTLETERGDCDDFALLAASVLASRGVEDLTLATITSGWTPVHVVVEAGGSVYSNGNVYEDTTIGEYVDQFDQFDRYLTRQIGL